MGGTQFGLHEHPGTDTADTFTEFRMGLDHIAFACDDRAALAWQTRLDELGIAHGGIVDAHYGTQLPRPRRDRPRVLRPSELTRLSA